MPPKRPTSIEHTFSVLIDAGHGGYDPGKVWQFEKGKGMLMEKDINLYVAKAILDHLPPFVQPHLTRRTDKHVPLRSRALTTFHYDLLVSIHCNSIEEKVVKDEETGEVLSTNYDTVFGTEVHVVSAKDDVLKQLANMFLKPITEALGISANEPNPIRSNPGFRILKLANRILDRKGRSMSCLRPAVADSSYGEKGKGNPGLLIELGYMTNPKDRKALMNKKKLNAVAKAIGHTIGLLAPKPDKA